MAPPALLAGGAFRYADAPGLEIVHQHLAPVPGQGDAEDVRRTAAYDDEAGIFGTQPLHRVLTQLCHALRGLRHEGAADTGGLAEGADGRHGLRACPASVLLGAADDERPQVEPGADVECADALRCVYLVAGDGHHVRAEALHREGQLEKALHRVAVQQRLGIRLLERAGDAGEVVDSAGLVVHQHERDEHRVRPERVGDRLHGYCTALVRGEAGDLIAAAFQLVERLAYGVVLREGTDDVAALGARGKGAGEQRPVVGLGAAGGEHQLLRLAAEAEGDLAPCSVEHALGLTPPRVRGARVAVDLRHNFVCHVSGLGTDPRRGRIVQIDVQKYHLRGIKS